MIDASAFQDARRPDVGLKLGGALAAAAAAVLAGFAVASTSGRYPPTLILAVLLVAVAAWAEPATCIVPFLLIEEYYRNAPALAAAPSSLTWGHRFYETLVFGVPLPLVVLCVGAIAAVFRRDRTSQAVARLRSFEGYAAGLAVVAVVLAGASSGAQGPRLVSAALRDASPWLTLVLAYTICVLRIQAGRYRLLVSLLVTSVVIKAGIAVAVEATSGGYTFEGQSHLIFYDAATPAIAVAIVMYLIAARRERLDWQRLVLLIASLLVVILSFRRSIWLMLPVGLFWVPLITRDIRAALRVAAVAITVVLIVVALPAAAINGQTSRIAGAFDVATGRSTNDTATQHEQDITEGLRLARLHPIDGLGVESPQASGLVNTRAKTVYVHNELLQEWLRFGILGLILTLGLLASLVRRGVSALRKEDERVARVAATWALVLPLPLMTAPFLGTTGRWPVVVAIAASLLAGAAGGPRKMGSS